MIAVLALVISIAAITLLAFGERLGLAAGIAGLLIPVILGLFVLMIAIASATSRLRIFLDAADAKSVLRTVSTQLVLLVTGLALLPGLTIADPRPGFVMLAAYVVTLVLVPSREPMTLLPDAERRMGGIDRANMIGLITTGFACLLFVTWFSPVLHWMARSSGFSEPSTHLAMLAVLAFSIVIGGLSFISRLAEGALAFATLFVGLPLALAAGAELLQSIDPAAGFGVAWPMRDVASGFLKLAWSEKAFTPALAGAGIGLVTLASSPGLGGPARRGGFGLLISALAGIIAYGFALEAGAIPTLVLRDLQPNAPQNWPLFAFDEAIRGWLLVCQQAPRDAIDVIQACRRSGVNGNIPAEMFEIRPDMIGPALAAARGVPAAFGLVSGLLGPLMAFSALALLLQVLAASFAETVLYRLANPRALRASRLVKIRLVVFAWLALFLLAPALATMADAKVALWLGLSLGLLLIVTLVAECILGFLRRFAGLLEQRRSPEPQPDPRPAHEIS